MWEEAVVPRENTTHAWGEQANVLKLGQVLFPYVELMASQSLCKYMAVFILFNYEFNVVLALKNEQQ